MAPEKAMELAEQGRCKEAMAALKQTVASAADADVKKRAGLLGVRCAMTLDNREAAGEFLSVLGRTFARDPEVLYVTVHAYSDLSTRAAQELAMTAPETAQAKKLSAESLLVQGKWQDAIKQYDEILSKSPKERGIHYRIAEVLISRPEVTPAEADQAKQELLEELEIDSRNAAAEFILGEIARQASDWPEAIERFSRAAKLDANFGDAFMGWGAALIAQGKYGEAVAPLRQAAMLQPGNTSAHYNLGMALLRSGQKEEADKEFAVQKRLLAEREAAKNALVEGNQPH